ncbi:hypothetical protein Scep_001432 [Stephania cephalantha]|uniref:Uncharacterized protein n=1 Tax=Stephania cephalantha TaxID=152367 RepID=A0AAP0Q7Q6_9MAGN
MSDDVPRVVCWRETEVVAYGQGRSRERREIVGVLEQREEQPVRVESSSGNHTCKNTKGHNLLVSGIGYEFRGVSELI